MSKALPLIVSVLLTTSCAGLRCPADAAHGPDGKCSEQCPEDAARGPDGECWGYPTDLGQDEQDEPHLEGVQD